MTDTNALIQRYRPNNWSEVIGQTNIVKSLQGILQRRTAHGFLFTGPSGVGKTTVARICAHDLGCSAANVIEINGATETGIEDMRALLENLRFMPFGASQTTCVIVDEAHRLTGNAWDGLLKIVEEPPEHVFWFFCTTVLKVPETIKTRCIQVTFKHLTEQELGGIFDWVCESEGISIPGDAGDLIIREAGGSPRQMLSYLELCREVTNKHEAAALLKTAVASKEAVELCRYIASGKTRGSWHKLMALVDKIDANPESVRIVVQNYMAKACAGAKSDNEACRFLQIMEAFADPYNAAEGRAPLLRSLGRVVFSN